MVYIYIYILYMVYIVVYGILWKIIDIESTNQIYYIYM